MVQLTTKVCRKCRKTKRVAQFHKKNLGTRAQCATCISEYSKITYATKAIRRQQIVDAVARRRKKILDFIAKQKKKPCQDCKVSYPCYVMDFHHRPTEEKTMCIARTAHNGWSKKKILKEIAKCDLICSNCHRERTFGGTI